MGEDGIPVGERRARWRFLRQEDRSKGIRGNGPDAGWSGPLFGRKVAGFLYRIRIQLKFPMQVFDRVDLGIERLEGPRSCQDAHLQVVSVEPQFRGLHNGKEDPASTRRPLEERFDIPRRNLRPDMPPGDQSRERKR
jgi:hypothetical protein